MTMGLEGRTIAYDASNRPASVGYRGASSSYLYGPTGSRVKKVTPLLPGHMRAARRATRRAVAGHLAATQQLLSVQQIDVVAVETRHAATGTRQPYVREPTDAPARAHHVPGRNPLGAARAVGERQGGLEVAPESGNRQVDPIAEIARGLGLRTAYTGESRLNELTGRGLIACGGGCDRRFLALLLRLRILAGLCRLRAFFRRALAALHSGCGAFFLPAPGCSPGRLSPASALATLCA